MKDNITPIGEGMVATMIKFVKDAFVVDGSVRFVKINPPVVENSVFICNDSKRGKFWVAWGRVKDER